MDKPQYPSHFSQPGGLAPGQAPQPVPNPYGQAPGGSYPPPGNSGGDNPLGLIAMICGLLSLILGCPLSIAAIVLGFIGMKKEPKGMATAGLILGIVTATLQLVFMCFFVAFYGLLFGALAAGTAATAPYIGTASAFQDAAAQLESHRATAGAYPSEAEGTGIVQGTPDGWGNQIVYRADGEEYVLVSSGPDGVLDNDDDMTFHAYEYVRPVEMDYSPTQRTMVRAADVLYESDSDTYPADVEGQSTISGFVDEWGRPIVYRQTDGGDGFLVISPGADGNIDTPDDVTYDGYDWTGAPEPSAPKPVDSAMSDPAETDPAAATSPSATKDAMTAAIALLAENDSEDYPSDEAGTAMIAHLKDEWGNALVYRKTGGDDVFLIVSAGPDGMLDTADGVNDETIEQSIAP